MFCNDAYIYIVRQYWEIDMINNEQTNVIRIKTYIKLVWEQALRANERHARAGGGLIGQGCLDLRPQDL